MLGLHKKGGPRATLPVTSQRAQRELSALAAADHPPRLGVADPARLGVAEPAAVAEHPARAAGFLPAPPLSDLRHRARRYAAAAAGAEAAPAVPAAAAASLGHAAERWSAARAILSRLCLAAAFARCRGPRVPVADAQLRDCGLPHLAAAAHHDSVPALLAAATHRDPRCSDAAGGHCGCGLGHLAACPRPDRDRWSLGAH